MKKTVKGHDHCSPLRRCNGVGMEGCKIVSMISTFHDNSTYTGTRLARNVRSPYVKRLQYDYGGIDLKIKSSPCTNGKKEGLKWYIKMFKDCSIVEDAVHASRTVRSLISRSNYDWTGLKPYAYSWRYFVLPDVFTKICHKSDVETLPPHRLKRDKPKRGHGLGRQNRRNELTEPTPSTSKE
ncbi:hypothetical protein EVAR_82416_1 [Eumeta japonica]|uniref:Uncharacterized protein n=1 Tax=Eumeta variegata TaxID=151549 RepID=A0A4C1YG02_EUMVA|nr:hypothetical protein EVAR_82416_1 [Eumeta japonica]